MDTDDLSKEAYNGILIESERLTHDLTIHFGVIAKNCKNEKGYLNKAEDLASNILQFNDNRLMDFFGGDVPEKNNLYTTLRKIIRNIKDIKKIPFDQLTYD
jgi:endonuclease IV